jgi:UPF0755 protein
MADSDNDLIGIDHMPLGDAPFTRFAASPESSVDLSRRREAVARRSRRRHSLALLWLSAAACGGSLEGDPVRFTVPPGSGFGAVADTLDARDIIRFPLAFRLYARLRGAERSIKPGVYETQRGVAWSDLLDKMVRGDVIQLTLVVPEGWTLQQIVPRLAAAAETDPDSLLATLLTEESAERYGVPGPTLEGYLYPATYIFPVGLPVDGMIRAMVGRHQRVWTEQRTALADSLGMTPQEVVTLASIVEKEARSWGERDTIAAVFHNRLRIGMPLQADPTVQYARGEHQTRLLYAHIEEVADHPYNTYTQRGLPPGPIASPSEGAIDATLRPAQVNYLYFVARPNGTHIFTRSLDEHNNARREVTRLGEQVEAPDQ